MSNDNPTFASTWPDGNFWRRLAWRFSAGVLLTFVVLGGWIATMPAARRDAMLSFWANTKISAPSFHLAPLLAVPLSVQVHVAGAVFALILGAVILLLPKGTGFHRALGWGWVSAMIVVAVTSVVMIADMRAGGINALHVFTALTVLSLWAGLSGIRRGDVRRHAGSMVGLYIGGLIVAGLFAFIPGRVMWEVVFGG
jgi:uncharacterized membrane protein